MEMYESNQVTLLEHCKSGRNGVAMNKTQASKLTAILIYIFDIGLLQPKFGFGLVNGRR